ncbi:copper amine oxidase N-terminal domain-containing protein [Paenibacillus chondroitinus]|uniref:Copper amine oxidase N-terminal domain-containing protein n=1 Tax=Paenibacillus chondroitinus TaxID=59842 RepID=A0ABU6D4N2_9BACL|nr:MULTISPECIES: copper amine oxidase N-terminal domain-containing protein [Paenibacillus]MCY9658317.1 copper amine oxidase N-terminal domain-containing protein [Paenibacillus anseongense]MEB4792684.1 copper amine oxidase N-terminal domain-containing protein [Paenibacillus chondroitinus]
MQIGDATAHVDGMPIHLEQAPTIENKVTLVPIRFIAENFQQTVAFDEQTRVITISPPVDQSSNTALPVKKRLDKPTVDNLTSQNSIKIPLTGLLPSSRPYPHYFLSDIEMISDGKDDLYFISQNDQSNFYIKKMNLSKGKEISLETILSFNDEKFDFEYKDEHGSVSKFLRYEFIPKSLFYDQASDRLFVMGRDFYNKMAVFYQVWPSVKMIAFDTSGQLDTDTDFIQPLKDGQTYVISNSFKNILYTAHEGERLTSYMSVEGNRMHHLVPLVSNGILYVLDRESKQIKEITPGVGSQVVATLNMDQINIAITHDGSFYLTDAKQFYRVNVEGEIEPYANMDLAIFKKGIFNSLTGNYDQMPIPPGYSGAINDDFEPKKMVLGISPHFAINADGNILIYDDINLILRKITVFEN